jgi:hypothetical protein
VVIAIKACDLGKKWPVYRQKVSTGCILGCIFRLYY